MSESMIPYPGMGSGHAKGSDTSRERQEREDAIGITAAAQQAALRLLAEGGRDGLTAAEFENDSGWGHGRCSSALSHLHRAGHVRRIKERRQRHEVYVLPEHVDGRKESPYRPRLPKVHPKDLPAEVLTDAIRKARLHNFISAEHLRQILKELP